MINITIPADNKPLAAAIGRALAQYGGDSAAAVGTAVHGAVESELMTGVEQLTPVVTATAEEIAGLISDNPGGGHVEPLADPLANHTAGVTTANTGAADDTPIDHKGVAKNPDYCSNAAKPFYASGPRSGQWKKRQGVEDAAYDAWHAGEVAKLPATTTTTDTPVDTAGAFSAGATTTAASTETVPHDSGTLMAWCSERQTAGLSSQTDINTAWANCGLTINDICAPTPPALVAENCSRIYYAITKLAGE